MGKSRNRIAGACSIGGQSFGGFYRRGVQRVINKGSGIAEVLSMLRQRAHDERLIVSADERVGTPSAAKLLQHHPDTLRAWRKESRGPAFYRQPVGKALISYRLEDLARHIERNRQPV
jgi:hypothetical protein